MARYGVAEGGTRLFVACSNAYASATLLLIGFVTRAILSYAEIFAALENFKRSGATYLLTTTFTGDRPNTDIATGGWRTLNFAREPFHFPEPLRVINEKCTEAGGAFGDKSIGAWRLADIVTPRRQAISS